MTITTLRLQNWTAKRSGPRMTISAKLADGQDVRFSADAIEVTPFGANAIDKKRDLVRILRLLDA